LGRASLTRREIADRLSRRVVSLGGIFIIASILAILVVIVAEVLPLFRPPSAAPRGTVALSLLAEPLAVGIDEYREVVYLVTSSGVEFVSAGEGMRLRTERPEGLGTARIVSTSALGRGELGLGLSDGRLIPIQVRFNVTFRDGRRLIDPEVQTSEPLVVAPGQQISHVAYARTQTGPLAAAVAGPRDLVVVAVKETRPLVGAPVREQVRTALTLPAEGEITQVVLDDRGDNAYVGTSAGEVTIVGLRDPAAPTIIGTIRATSRAGAGVSALALLLGDRTLLIGDVAGGVTSWLILPGVGEAGLFKAHDYQPHSRPVVALAPSRRDKGFLSLDTDGTVHVNYSTTGRTLLEIPTGGAGVRAVGFAPKADGLVAVDASGRLAHWSLRNPHPQITLLALFGKVLYEGYRERTYVWQSTGATDDFEEKFSLTPLIFGTLKGTFYALLVAVPVALLSAVYTSQFMHPTLKGIVKPIVEIMAALPSVVLGFLAGLWLAPRMEKVVPGVAVLPVVFAGLILLGLAGWRLLPMALRRRVRPGTELFLFLPLVLVAGVVAFWLGGLIEGAFLGGDYRGWLLRVLGVTYDQRNSLVVGFAMGFAVIPIIFTISEDALSNVPPYLSAGSLALGATRWQTALRVVLPTASPGIFSAVMIGFGRAVGETMIVLMATGNTPVMNWSIFNGFRALSANVAVELPEAPAGGTLFRVLFLAALLLFLMTFLVNTAAEIVRLRLRKRYQAI
jgi:phosphate transport system permease protein